MRFPKPENAGAAGAPLYLRLLPDERLARRAEKGARRAVEEIDRRYRQDLYRFCLAMVGDPRGAEAALEGAIAKAHRGLETGERQIRLKPWLYRIARSETMDALCGPRLASTPAPEQDRLLADLERLPQRQRAVFVMRELSGLGFVEIGAAFGIPAATAERDHSTARERLGQLDSRRGGIDPAALPPLPLAAGGGSGLAGTIAAGLGDSVGASVVVKATATVAVVAAAGLSVQERGNRDVPPPGRGDRGAALIASAPGHHAPPRPVAPGSPAGVAVRRGVPPSSSTPPTPTAFLHQSERSGTGGASALEQVGSPAPSDGPLTVAAAPAGPPGERSQLDAQPPAEVGPPYEEGAHEGPGEAVAVEPPEAESQPPPVEPLAQEESPATPAAPPVTPESPVASPAPPSVDRGWVPRRDSRGHGSRRRW